MDVLRRYARWLHLRWPAGRVERLPRLGPAGETSVPGVYVTGDLTGIPLLKFAADSGARTVRAILADPGFAAARAARPEDVLDLAIVGAGVSGMAAALETRRAGLAPLVLEAAAPFATIADFPAGKPIFAYPRAMVPAGDLRVTATVKEDLAAELAAQAADVPVVPGRVVRLERRRGRIALHLEGGGVREALRVVLAVGRSGDFRRLGVPGQDLDKVHHRLHDPRDHAGRRVLVVGGGDAALETAAALSRAGASVVLAHRGADLARAKEENAEEVLALAREARLRVALGTRVVEILPGSVVLSGPGGPETLANDVVFVLIGREAPLDLFRRSGIAVQREWTGRTVAGFALFLLFCAALYDWKSGGRLDAWSARAGAFPHSLAAAAEAAPAGSLARVLLTSASTPSFAYTVAYSALVVAFGVRRIRRRRTPYVTRQTLALMAIQVVPLFLLPEVVLPWLDANGRLPAPLADALFPRVDYGHGREFWRAYGLILAWPLNVYNVFTERPLPWWLAIAFVQTFVLIPAAIYVWGKGAYCGWVCSCGALAETLGDAHRHKMPHGPGTNRLNLAGQALLAVAFALLAWRVAGWAIPGADPLERSFRAALSGPLLSWKWTVDVLLAGVVGYGAYFWLSGRVWCRFFCPLAALMHVYARFSRFRILADKKKCISCNVCTSVCHQGIDVMAFANKGLPMADPQCVRCSACVSSCPTGVLSFGQVDPRTERVLRADRVPASLVQIAEAAPGGPGAMRPS
jgi:NosR/NirI family nitrous oxide reductase transcriptional regulator